MVIERFVDNVGKHRFRVKADNGQICLKSQGYASRSGSKKGIDSVKDNGGEGGSYSHYTNGIGFNLKAKNGQTIGTSPVFDNNATRDEVIAAMVADIKTASIIDI